MIFSLDVRRARKGDCLLLHYGTPQEPGLWLIDGGPAQVYHPHLKPRIGEIRDARGLANNQALPVDLVMVSHIDDDHINGILELTSELVIAQDEQKPKPLRIRSFWHNTFDNIIGNTPDELVASVTASFGAAALGGEADTEGLDQDTAKVLLASVDQGFRLRNDVKKLQLKINREFDGDLVLATEDSESLDMPKGVQVTVVGPMKPAVLKLQKDHDAFLKKKKAGGGGAEAALAALTDKAVANLASIVVLVRTGDKTILLTGDARGDKILEGMQLVGAIDAGGSLHVDILKGQHHGSDRNVDNEFFQRVTADHYVFSGNGEHGNPERETLKMLLAERGNADYTVHLTYPVDEIDVARKADWAKEQAKEKAKKKKKPATKVRPNWNRKKHSLEAFLDANPAFANKVVIVSETEPHVIDLLDPLGF